MATISINIPDAVLGRVVDAMAARYGWTSDSGLTKVQFAKRILTGLLKETVKMHEGQIASAAATQTASSTVDEEINIT
jgi:hypothetical protein